MAMLGGLIAGIGAIMQGVAQSNADKYQAAVAKNNAIIAEQNAVYETQAGQVEEQASRMKTGQTIGDAKAIQSASGVDAASGSPVKVRETTATVGELDALTIRDNAARRAYGYRSEGVNFKAQAGLYNMQASSDMLGGIFSGLGSIVGSMGSMIGGGSSSVSSKWGSMMSPSVGGSSGWQPLSTKGPAPNTLLQYTLPRY